jgi:hypothetical protein
MGVHTLNLAKHKIRAAQEHLKAALQLLKEENGSGAYTQLDLAAAELVAAKALAK